MKSKFPLIICLSVLLTAQSSFLPKAYAQTMGDSFSIDSGDSPSGISDTDTSDLFGDDIVTGQQLNNNVINLKAEVFVRSLPNNLNALYGILDQLLRGRLNSWHYPNISRLSLWMNYCRAVLSKAAGICFQSGTQNTVNSQTNTQFSDAKEDKIACLKAWSAAFDAVLGLLPHNRNEEQEPRVSQSKAEAQKAIELAETICHSNRTGRNLPAPPQQPTDAQNLLPLPAPSRGNVWTQPSESNLVTRGKDVSTSHYNKVRAAVESLPANVQQFLISHKVKIVAVDTLVSEHPELQGKQPTGHPRGQTWANLDAAYLSSKNEVDVADRIFTGTWHSTSRVESVAFHEIGHAVDVNSNSFSENDKTYLDNYNEEKATLSKADRQQLGYFLNPPNIDAHYELFGELFAMQYGSVPSGPDVKELLGKRFSKTFDVVKTQANSL